MKRIIKIIIILVIVIGAAIGGYFLWQYFSTDGAPAGSPIPSPGSTYIPNFSPQPTVSGAATEGPLTVWGNTALAGYYLKNGTATGLATNGQVVSIRGKSTMQLNSSIINEAILKMTPSSDGKWFLEKWGSGGDPRFSLYDTNSNTWTTFADLYFADMDFAPGESKIAYLEPINGKVNLGIMDLSKKTKDGFVRATLDSFMLRDVEISWSASNTIFMSEKPSARVPGSMWKYTISAKRLDPVIIGQNGLWVLWNKAAGYGIKFSRATQSELEIIDVQGSTIFTSPLLTFPDKCTLSGRTLYCAIPQISPPDKDLPDAYLKRSFYTNDSIYKIDLASGELKLLFPANSSQMIDVVNLQIESDKLYFINRYDYKLYQLIL